MRLHKYLFIVVFFLLPAATQGAGFDCAKARTRIEKLVCQDPTLSELDSEMSEAYAKALKHSNSPLQLKSQQRRWLRDVRNQCADIKCLKSAYILRNKELLTKREWMTNEKERVICNAVVDAVSDESIIERIKTFAPASGDERRTWKDNQPWFSSLSVSQSLTIDIHGKATTLGLVRGGGTCGNCDIVDINASATAVYPPDDADERFRWLGWGQCDYFLFVEGEPIIVTGNFRSGLARATFVSWLAPDGAKRALCHLGPDPAKKATKTITVNSDPKLCDAVGKNKIEYIPWSDTLSIPRESIVANRWDSGKDAVVDIDLDGNKETIVLLDYASGAGCGSYRQWLHEFVPTERSVVSNSAATTALNGIFASHGTGPIENARKGDEWYSVRLFRHGGKPYILAEGEQANAAVLSVWGNQKRTWCEYRILPQHKVEVLYPIETWPPLTIPKLRQIKGGQALHNAASGNNLKRALALIRDGTPVDAADDSGQTPLVQASSRGHIGMVKLLLDHGASVDGVPTTRMTPLMSATVKNNVEMVELLLARKADPNLQKDPRTTTLGIARKLEVQYSRNPNSEGAKKSKRIIELLLDAGATE